MGKKWEKRQDPRSPVGEEGRTDPTRLTGSALFNTSGPVKMVSGKRMLTLGNTGADKKNQTAVSSAYSVSEPEQQSSPFTFPPMENVPRTPEIMELPIMPETVIAHMPPETEAVSNARVPSASTSWSPSKHQPRIDRSSFVHPEAVVIGNVIINDHVFIAPGAVLRADNEEPIHIGSASNIQEGVILKDLPTKKDGVEVQQRVVEVQNERFSLYIGQRVSVAAQAQVHGPAYIADGVYIGMQSLVFWARIEAGVVIEPGCLIMNVTIPAGVFVPAGLKVTNQNIVKDLPILSSKYRFLGIGEETVAANLEMLDGYRTIYH